MTKRPSGEAPKSDPSNRRWPKRLLLWSLKWGLICAIWGVVIGGGIAVWYAADLPDIDTALAATRPPTVTVVAADGVIIAESGDLYGLPVQARDLPPALVQAVLATEDRRFYSHFGLDPIGLARAFVANVRAGGVVQGGSTLTQQLAKNLFLTPARTIKRKVQEVLLAVWLERHFSKDQILTVYLNRVYLGAGTYGVEAAARRYFGRRARDLDLYQSAMLAGLLKAPSRYNPAASPERAARRTAQVLTNMVAAGYLTEADVQAARRGHKIVVTAHRRATRHFVDWVLEQVPAFVSPGDRDLVVVTTLDSRLQRAAEAAVLNALDGPGKAVKASQGALVALAHDGAVRAMVGGRDYRASQFNRATQARRQPGSAFKPFVYVAGLEAGLRPHSRLVDAPLTIEGWSPRNFKRRHRGEVTLTTAMADSINTIAVQVAERAGRSTVVRAARRLGITAPLKATPSLALGVGEVSLIELTAAYGAFANGGIGVWAYGIEEVRDAGGRALYRRSGSGPGRVLDGRVAADIGSMLGAVITGGTGRAAAFGRPAAGKTGTSQESRDAWFVGYSADLVAGVWVGNDNGQPMQNVTGGGLPARLWRRFMTVAHAGLAPRPLAGAPAGAMAPRPTPARERQPAPIETPKKDWWEQFKDRFGAGG